MSTAVDSINDSMKNTSLEGSDAAQAQQAAPSTAEHSDARLYIGNLAYATTETELKDFFTGYSVVSTTIPVNPRTNRPVGYAFVELPSPSQAEDAIQKLSGKEILERKVSVQLARKPDEVKKEQADEDKPAGRGRNSRGRAGRAGRRGGGRAGAEEGAGPLADVTNEANKAAPDAAAAATTTDSAKAHATRAPKQRGPPEDGIPSEVKVMVANIPYDLTEEKLQELFQAYQPVSAKIALRPIPRYMIKKLLERGEKRKGRGFGFVTLASHEQQQKAVAEMNGKEIEGREIAVKVAIDSPGKEDAPEGEGEGEAATGAAGETKVDANGTNGVSQAPATTA